MVNSHDRGSVNTRQLFFLDVGRMPPAFQESIQFHMESYCSAIKETYFGGRYTYMMNINVKVLTSTYNIFQTPKNCPNLKLKVSLQL